MACGVAGTREPQPHVRRLPRLDGPRWQAPARHSGRAVSGPVGARRATPQGGRYSSRRRWRRAARGSSPGPHLWSVGGQGTDLLGERPFDAGPSLIELLPLRAGRPGLCRGQRLVLVLGWQPQPPAGVLGPGTAGPYGTRPTGLFVEGPNDGATALPPPMLPPRHRQVALGAAHLLLVPVHRDLLHGVRALDLRLPPLAGTCGAPQGDALAVAAVDE